MVETATEGATPEAETASTPLENAAMETPAGDPAPVETATSVAPQTAPAVDDPMAKAKAALAADLRFLVQAGHLIEFHNGTFDLPLPPKPKEEPPSAANKQANKAPGAPPKEEDTPTSSPANADGQEAERAGLTVESVTILPPDAPREDEPAPSLESGIEKTEAQMIADPGHLDSPGIVVKESHEVTPDPVVIGDAESAHPLSPS